MNLRRSIRTLYMLLLIGMILFGLASCRLPASSGPQAEGTTSESFPVPGETGQAPGEIDVNVFATQTAQIILPVVITSGGPTPAPTQPNPYPIATTAPATAVPTEPEITYVEPTPGGPPATYTLRQGEYPFCIARRFDVNQAELLSLNNLTLVPFFYAGMELKIPQTGTPFDGIRTLHEHPTTYEVQSGDTLGSIACYFGDVSPDVIAEQNNVSDDDLKVGEELVIP